MAGELKPFLNANGKEGWVHERRGSVHLWRLTWPRDQGEWIAACAGAGQRAATRAFAEAEKDGAIDLVYSVGWAGALNDAYLPGRAYQVSAVTDLRSGERFEALGRLASAREVEIESYPSEKNKDVAGVGHPGFRAEGETWLVTSPRVADAAEKRRLAAAYKGGLVDMEAAAIVRLAAMRGIPFGCIKGVSDSFTEDLPDFNRFISPEGQFQMVRLLFFVLPRPWHWPALIRMGENSKKASQAIRDILLENLNRPGVIANQHGDPNLEP
jgi:adenosylhomocysteine nucleosidase